MMYVALAVGYLALMAATVITIGASIIFVVWLSEHFLD